VLLCSRVNLPLDAEATHPSEIDPREHGCARSFNGRLQDERPGGEISYTLQEAVVLNERWGQRENRLRPHSALGYALPGRRRSSSARWASVRLAWRLLRD
jgi:transposase InsO family protein